MTRDYSGTNIYIIGAGIAGTMLSREVREKGIFGNVIAFLDDDSSKIGKLIDGIPVLGTTLAQLKDPLWLKVE